MSGSPSPQGLPPETGREPGGTAGSPPSGPAAPPWATPVRRERTTAPPTLARRARGRRRATGDGLRAGRVWYTENAWCGPSRARTVVADFPHARDAPDALNGRGIAAECERPVS